MFLLMITVPVAIGLTGGGIFAYRERERLQADRARLTLQYDCLKVNHEALVCAVTEPYYGVLASLEDVGALAACLSRLPDGPGKRAAQGALARVEYRQRILLDHVAARYHLTTAEKRRLQKMFPTAPPGTH